MFNFNSFKFSVVLIIVYIFLVFIFLLFLGKHSMTSAITPAITAAAIGSVKYIIGAVIAWIISRKTFSFACAINIALAAHIVAEVLGKFL